jgi:hypothetical protein
MVGTLRFFLFEVASVGVVESELAGEVDCKDAYSG